MNTMLCRACPRGLFTDATYLCLYAEISGFTAALGEGKNSVLPFDATPINSFAVDSQVFKRGLAFHRGRWEFQFTSISLPKQKKRAG